jgi:DNA-binding CsgD family transcriptional regulator
LNKIQKSGIERPDLFRIIQPVGCIFFIVLAAVLFGSCKQRVRSGHESLNQVLDSIELHMFYRPESLDSLLNKIDTTNISSDERARLGSIKGLSDFEKGEIDQSIRELEKAETFFIRQGDQFHNYINKLIRAFTLEQLVLNDQAAELFMDCDHYFGRNHLETYQFYATLGLFRLSKQLNLDKKELINRLQKAARQFNDPNYYGLLYATMGVYEKNDSIKKEDYVKARSYIGAVHRWSRIYALDLNLLFARIKEDPSKSTQLYYDDFNKRNYLCSPILYTPTARQRMFYKIGQAYLYAKQGKRKDAIEVAERVLKETSVLKITKVETESVKLLSFLYKRIHDFKNAHAMLERYHSLMEKDLESLQQSRLLALGAHYRYSELEREKLELKMKNQKYLFLIVIISLILIVVFFIFRHSLKKSKYERENLKLKNLEIEDQISRLILSLGNQKDRNKELIKNAEELKAQYSDSLKISDFLEAIDQDRISTWMEYEACFQELRPGWVDRLKHEVPELTATDLRYCMCLYFNLNNYRIAKLCDTGIEGVKAAKKRIRDKFSLKDAKEIYFFLKNIG